LYVPPVEVFNDSDGELACFVDEEVNVKALLHPFKVVNGHSFLRQDQHGADRINQGLVGSHDVNFPLVFVRPMRVVLLPRELDVISVQRSDDGKLPNDARRRALGGYRLQ
jgi:hypothetical protein